MKELNNGKPRVVVIPEEEAVFWLDEQGDWRNEHGPFEHPRIIEYFHSSIKHDFSGYYVEQVNGDVLERVYFPYKDTALFVFKVISGAIPVLVLNTGRRIELDPAALFMDDEDIYVRLDGVKAKFVKHGLKAIAKMIDFEKMTITVNGRQHSLSTKRKKGFRSFLKDLFKKI